jgi:hypothetical protein
MSLPRSTAESASATQTDRRSLGKYPRDFSASGNLPAEVLHTAVGG